MNRNSIKNYFIAIVAAVLSVATISACKKDSPSEEEDNSKYTIILESKKVISAEAEGEDLEISYRISGATLDKEAIAEADVDWLSVKTTKSTETTESEIKTITFTCAANQTADDRTGKITLSLKGAKSVGVSVLQKANPDYKVNSKMTLSLDAEDIKETSALITVAPNATDSYYYYCIVKAEDYNSFENGSAFVADRVEKIKTAAEEYAEKYGTTYSLSGYLYKGYRAQTYKGFTPSTEFVLVAFAMSLSGDYAENYETCFFKTKDITPSSSDFEITLSTDKSTLKVTPRDKYSEYYIILTNASLWETYMTPEACVEAYMEDYTPSYVYTGESTVTTGLADEGDYVLLVFGYDNSLEKTTTGISYLLFHYDGN